MSDEVFQEVVMGFIKANFLKNGKISTIEISSSMSIKISESKKYCDDLLDKGLVWFDGIYYRPVIKKSLWFDGETFREVKHQL